MSIEGFTCLLVFKNLFSFGLTFKGFDWMIEANNNQKVFNIIGSVQLGICALTIPMCTSSSSTFPILKHSSIALLGPLFHRIMCDSPHGNSFLIAISDIFGKRNRSFWYRHNIFFKASDWAADRLSFWEWKKGSGNARDEDGKETSTAS